MAFQDSNHSAATESIETNDTAPAVELAVFNLDSVTHVADHQMIAYQVESYLQACGSTSLQTIQANANVSTVANIFALCGSSLDLLLYALVPQDSEAAIQRNALLAANLIGLFAEPQNEAHVRMALRPMLGLMAECLYPAEGEVKAPDLRRMELHLNAQMAGDLELFLKETQGKLASLISRAGQLGVEILQSLIAPSTGVMPPTTDDGATAEKRDPTLQFSNWASPLIDLIQFESEVDLYAKLEMGNPAFQEKITNAIAQLSTDLDAQNNAGTQYSLAWLIQQTLTAIKNNENQGTASVPITQTGEYERHTDGDILEFVSLQADALNAPPCPGEESGTSGSISYAIGAERINHSDFTLPKLGFSFSRQYNSQMAEYEDSAIGARWMMPFANKIIPQSKDFLFIDSTGRKHHLPASITQHAYEVPYEGIYVTPLENGDLSLHFTGDWNFIFHQFKAEHPYYLIGQINSKTQEQVVLDYLVLEGKAYLKQVDFKLKTAEHSLKFAYNEQVKIIAVFIDEQEEPLSRYVYNSQGDLIQAIDEHGHSRQYEYNAHHQLTSYTDRTGRGQNIRYDSTAANAKAIEEWADDGSFRTRLKWHERLRQVTVYDANEVATAYYFDLDGFTYRIRLADGREKWYSRDQQKRITREIDFTGRETQQYYDDAGQLIKSIQPNGGIVRFAYDEQGNLSEIKDPEGNLWLRKYNADGLMTEEINPLGHKTQYQYDAEGQLISIIDAKGGSKKLQYNALGQMISYTDCSGKESVWEYDEEGQLQEQQLANQTGIQYLYSASGQDKGQLQSIVYPDGLKEQFEHDAEGRLLKHIDTKGQVTQYQYNAVGLLERRIDPNLDQIQYVWDKEGRIKKLINQNQAEYGFEYNRYGQLIREQAFDGEVKQFRYDGLGRLAQIEQPNIITQLGYYADGQIAEKTYIHQQTGFKQTESFAYNLNGQLAQVKNDISQNDFYRDAVGQLVREHQHYQIPGLKPMTAVLRHEYDELGNLIKTIRPDGQELRHLTYGSGHIYGIALNQHDLVAFQRDDLHRETTRLLANGLVQTSAYNEMGLLSRQSIQAEQDSSDFIRHQASRQYQYDQNYLLTQVEDSRLGKLSYQYDAIGRLTQSNSAQGTERFNFDPAGNLIDVNSAHTNVLKNNLIREYQGKYYRYDAQGNVIESQKAGEVLKLKWDNLNRLIESERNGQVTEYGYDVFGRRLYKKSHHNNQNQLTLFGWDGDLMIWESKQGSHPQDHYTKHYIYEANSFVPLLQAGYRSFIQLKETPNYKELFKNQPYAMRKDPLWRDDTRNKRKELEKVAFYHCDQVGTPQTLSNERGECIWEIIQNTWGEALEIKASDGLLEQSHLRFQGQYYDEETELHYNRYRYYEPYSARYISKDPIGLDGGINTSTYVANPMQWVDPLGLQQVDGNFMGNGMADWANSQASKSQTQTSKSQTQTSKSQTQTQKPQTNSQGGGILGHLLPGTMSSFARNPQTAHTLKNRQGMRNVGTTGAIIAASPYAAIPMSNVAGAGVKAPVMGAVGAAGMDGAFQGADSIACKCNAFNYKRTLGVAGIGAVTAGMGANLAKISGVEYVTLFSIHKNLQNSTGLKILAGQTAATTIATFPVKSNSKPVLKLEEE